MVTRSAVWICRLGSHSCRACRVWLHVDVVDGWDLGPVCESWRAAARPRPHDARSQASFSSTRSLRWRVPPPHGFMAAKCRPARPYRAVDKDGVRTQLSDTNHYCFPRTCAVGLPCCHRSVDQMRQQHDQRIPGSSRTCFMQHVVRLAPGALLLLPPKSSNHYPTFRASCGGARGRCSGVWRCPVLSVVLVKGVRGNLGSAWTALDRTLISACEIPQLAGVHGARTIAPPTASLSICPRLASS